MNLKDKHFGIFTSQQENKIIFSEYLWMTYGLTRMKLRKNRRTKWTAEERQKLRGLFEKFDGDIGRISKELRRGERSVRMNLFFMDLITENEVDRRV
tara:strand:- start:16 stop:306 length:291 start_codon:yes stop_codon:yes gene_type:complete